MSSNCLTLNPSKTEFLVIGLPKRLEKLNHLHLRIDVVLSPVDSARDLGVIFDSNLTLSDHISAVSKSCLNKIRDLRRILNIIDRTTACTITTSLVYSKLYYFFYLISHPQMVFNLFLNLPLMMLL